MGHQRLARGYQVWYTVSETRATDIRNPSTPRDDQYYRKISHRSAPYLSRMRIIGILFFWTVTNISWVHAQRSFFQDKYGNGVPNARLRQGNIAFSEIPGVIVAMTNNLLSFV